jgi:hypothetical protein
MDIIFNNLDLLKIFTISLIKLNVNKDLILKLMYHMYNVHQSNKCTITNLLFPKSKETCDEIIKELDEEEDKEIIEFMSILKSKIQNEIFDRNVDAVSVAIKTFTEINQHCKFYQQIGNQSWDETYLTHEQFNACCDFEKELILYKCMDHNQRDIYFHKKKLKPGVRKNMKQIYESLEIKCSKEIYDKITKKKSLQPVLWEIRKKHGDEIIYACGDQKSKMDFILSLIQKIYL